MRGPNVRELLTLIYVGFDSDGRGNKRRQPESVHSSSTPDDDDDSYLPLPVQKKKLTVGTGYAGDVREDVSDYIVRLQILKFSIVG